MGRKLALHLEWDIIYREGATDAEIAAEFGVLKQTVRRWRARTGRSSNRPRGRLREKPEFNERPMIEKLTFGR